jgi:hypothetical protein
MNHKRWTNDSGQEGGENEHLMDRQYEYVSVGDFDHHGFLSHDTGNCIDSVVKKRIVK